MFCNFNFYFNDALFSRYYCQQGSVLFILICSLSNTLCNKNVCPIFLLEGLSEFWKFCGNILTLIFIGVYSLRIMEDSFHRRINKHCIYNHIVNWFIFTGFFKVSVEMFKVGLIYENLFATVFLELL